ncbi:MAG: hypothetical protein OHK0013_07940 [Sandaracinaceae bacterium]
MRSSSVFLGWASSAALLASASAGCSFVVDFDRSRVGPDTGAAMDAGRDGGPPADDTGSIDGGPTDAGMMTMDDAGMMTMDDAGMMTMNDVGMMMINDAGMMTMNDAGMMTMNDAGMMTMNDAGPIVGDAGPCGGDPRLGMACDPTNACETGTFVCNAGVVECMGTGTPRPSTHVCRAAMGDCDVAETCDGTSLTCPIDAFRPSTFECRASTGECDPAEVCSGSSATCPTDAFALMGTACTTPAMGQCSGTSATCGCAPGFTPCSGVCVDTATDPLNCGMCGMTCTGGTPNCAGSTCVP